MRIRFFLPFAASALAGCMAPPPSPPLTPNPPGGVYRAVGTEPFWDLTIDERQMVFTDRGNNIAVAQPTPRVIVGIAGEIYQTPRLNVNIVHRDCSDGMSDRAYPDTVQVDVEGHRYNGCGGGAVAPTSLAGTSWRIGIVNGRSTPPNRGEYYMRFEQNRLSARFGCNSMGADYTQTANIVNLGPVMATRMACPDMSFESQGGAILNQPMTMSWSGGDRLTLSNAAGRIELVRSY
jgi:heat shock protein HslJ